MNRPSFARRRVLGIPVPDVKVPLSAAALVLTSLAAVVYSNGNPAVATLPVAAAVLVVTVANVPLRRSLLVLAFFVLILENPAEAPASGLWRSPLFPLGVALLSQLKNVVPVNALVFTGLDVFLLLFALVWTVRRAVNSPLDVDDHVPSPSPLVAAALLSWATIAFMWVHGISTGGSLPNSLWQLFRVIYLPGVFLLFSAGIRGAKDAAGLGKVLMAAAIVRACLAIYLRQLFPDILEMPHATTHADSMLFANASVLLLVRWMEVPGRREKLEALFGLPILVFGMIANNRRLVWVEIAMAIAAVALVNHLGSLRVKVGRVLVVTAPLLLLYVGLGWSHPTGPFAPVRTIRSLVDSNADSSTLWRDWENYNLYSTIRKNPLLGVGYGQPYDEVVQLPDISTAYALYRYAPHNSILGIVAYGGALGFMGIFLMIPFGVFFAVRAYRASRTGHERVAALGCLAVFVTYLMHCYGDMALGTWTSVFTVGGALALSGKLAVSTGAWPFWVRGSTRLRANSTMVGHAEAAVARSLT